MRKTQIFVTDDLDGTEGAGPVRFGLDGENFEIDLSEGNHSKFRELASFYIRHARVITPAMRRTRNRSVYGHFGSTSQLCGPRITAARREASG
jgi:Lsr2